jgi:magnesium-transporting ATPase (P-type)
VEGDSYEPQGNIYLEGSDEPVQIHAGSVLETYLRTIDLCNDSQLIQDERGLWGITGGPTEGALKVLAAKAKLPPVETQLVAKIPFDSQYKYMATQQKIDDVERVLITGAPDVIFALCREQMTSRARCRSSASTGRRRWRASPARGCAWLPPPANRRRPAAPR